ncbi:MAG: hypothetical protein WC073_10325 [Sterolibacterium sp.]
MRRKLVVAFAAWLLSFGAVAGSISFQLSQTGSLLTVTSKGDSSAFYPAVFRMLADGRWGRLATLSGTAPPAELLPGAHIDLLWPESRPLQTLSAVERLQPLMVRFFDQAGVSFGQITFLHPPPAASEILPVRYANGLLSVSPPSDGSIHATWILWAQEEGIESIRLPVDFDHIQPAARRVEWHAGMDSLRLATGAAQPTVMLVHETASGPALQTAARGVSQGRQQRSGWLDAQGLFYALALSAAALALLLPALWGWRGRAGE